MELIKRDKQFPTEDGLKDLTLGEWSNFKLTKLVFSNDWIIDDIIKEEETGGQFRDMNGLQMVFKNGIESPFFHGFDEDKDQKVI